MKVIADCSEGRDNNFNLIRMIAAMMVLLNHSFDLLGLNGRDPLTQLVGVPASTIGVNVFFIISGFLVAGSYLRAKDLIAFLESRILRIFPGLFVCVLFCALIVGAAFTTLPLEQYYSRKEVWEFILINSTLLLDKIQLRYLLPGVFTTNAYAQGVNGSLWTLPYEVWLYVFLALMGVCGLLRRRAMATLVLVSIIVVDIAILTLLGTEPPLNKFHNVARFSMHFSIGIACYLNRDLIPLHGVFFGLAFVAMFVPWSKPLSVTVFPLALAYSVLWLAYVPSGFVRSYSRLGDFSYGTYIYAFPVQQALISLVPGLEPTQLFLLAFPFTVVFAAASWHMIEKRALDRKGRLAASFVRVRSGV